MNFREVVLSTGTRIFLGKNSQNNDELVAKFRGKGNVILHTIASGSPFCVAEKMNPTKKEIYEAGVFCASKSQAWRDGRRDVRMHVFTGKDVKKHFWMKEGSWKLKNKPKEILIKKEDVLKIGK